jgi:hypothetical protein
MTPEEKKRRFRELAQHDRIQTGRQLAEELEQPYLSFNEFKQENHAGAVPGGRWRLEERKP